MNARTFIITLTAPASAFQLSDLLKQRTVIEPLDVHLKRAVKGATKSYLSAAEGLISRLATEPSREQESSPNGKWNARNCMQQSPTSRPPSEQRKSDPVPPPQLQSEAEPYDQTQLLRTHVD